MLHLYLTIAPNSANTRTWFRSNPNTRSQGIGEVTGIVPTLKTYAY
ncbi:hypothetical protein [Coleofasciculus sp. E1-EBD-02]